MPDKSTPAQDYTATGRDLADAFNLGTELLGRLVHRPAVRLTGRTDPRVPTTMRELMSQLSEHVAPLLEADADGDKLAAKDVLIVCASRKQAHVIANGFPIDWGPHVIAPCEMLAGRGFRKIISLWTPTNDSERQWAREVLPTKLKVPGAQVIWACGTPDLGDQDKTTHRFTLSAAAQVVVATRHTLNGPTISEFFPPATWLHLSPLAEPKDEGPGVIPTLYRRVVMLWRPSTQTECRWFYDNIAGRLAPDCRLEWLVNEAFATC